MRRAIFVTHARMRCHTWGEGDHTGRGEGGRAQGHQHTLGRGARQPAGSPRTERKCRGRAMRTDLRPREFADVVRKRQGFIQIADISCRRTFRDLTVAGP